MHSDLFCTQVIWLFPYHSYYYSHLVYITGTSLGSWVSLYSENFTFTYSYVIAVNKTIDGDR